MLDLNELTPPYKHTLIGIGVNFTIKFWLMNFVDISFQYKDTTVTNMGIPTEEIKWLYNNLSPQW